MDWPIYYKDILRLGSADSTLGVATGWTICDQIIEKWPKNLYSVSGQLYTKTGINFLVRNLLANKKIRHLIICGQDRGGAAKELLSLWKSGKSDYLDKEITPAAIAEMLTNVELIDMIGEENSDLIRKKAEELDQKSPAYGELEIFPEAEKSVQNELLCHFPTDASVFKIRGKKVAEVWLKALKTILTFGEVKETDAMKMKEVLNLAAVIEDEDADNFFIPEYLGFDKAKVESYLPQIIDKEKVEGLHYTYGYRLSGHFEIDQVEKMIEKLRKDPNAREAVGVLFDPRIDIEAEHRPCIVLVQALRNQEKLNFNVYVRSHDIFGGWPLNAFGLRKLQQKISQASGLNIGSLTFISASAHIYDFNWPEAQKIIAKNNNFILETDPRGYFLISINKSAFEIEVKHFSPEGFELRSWSQSAKKPKAALEIARKINNDLALSLTEHALDLGIELQKAESALRLGLEYVQDQPFLLAKVGNF